MICPIDQTELVISERQGVEIDYCPKCRGVWLDRGELDKVIERSELATTANNRQYMDRDDDRNQYRDRHDDNPSRYDGPKKKKKKESFLSELFDFG